MFLECDEVIGVEIKDLLVRYQIDDFKMIIEVEVDRKIVSKIVSQVFWFLLFIFIIKNKKY